jgi:hypothetical protein
LWISHDINPVISEPIKGTTAISMKVGKKHKPKGPSSHTSDFLIAFKTSLLWLLWVDSMLSLRVSDIFEPEIELFNIKSIALVK